MTYSHQRHHSFGFHDFYTHRVRFHVLLLSASNVLIRGYGPQPIAAFELIDFRLNHNNENMHQSFFHALLIFIRMHSVRIHLSTGMLHRIRLPRIYRFCDLQPICVQHLDTLPSQERIACVLLGCPNN